MTNEGVKIYWDGYADRFRDIVLLNYYNYKKSIGLKTISKDNKKPKKTTKTAGKTK